MDVCFSHNINSVYIWYVCVCVCVCVGGGEDKPPKSHISLDLHKLRERLHLMDNRGEGRTKSLQGRGQQRGRAEEGKGCGDYVNFPKSERQVLGFWERFSSLTVALRLVLSLSVALYLSLSLSVFSLSLSLSLSHAIALSLNTLSRRHLDKVLENREPNRTGVCACAFNVQCVCIVLTCDVCMCMYVCVYR